jgi:tetratricopeptide (TPR) repeat protein
MSQDDIFVVSSWRQNAQRHGILGAPAAPDPTRASEAVHRARRLRVSGHLVRAKKILDDVIRFHPDFAPARYVYGLVLSDLGQPAAALLAFEEAGARDPSLPGVWLAITEHAKKGGNDAREKEAFAKHVNASARSPHVSQAVGAILAEDFAGAEVVLRRHLQGWPNDAAAMALLAEVLGRAGRLVEAASLFKTCLDLAPYFETARENFLAILYQQRQYAQALEQSNALLVPGTAISLRHRKIRAGLMSALGDLDGAIASFEVILREQPDSAETWIGYGNALKGAGRQEEAVSCYRKAVALKPHCGMAWWSISNLKTVGFASSDISNMQVAIANPAIDHADRLLLHFAVGKAMEDEKRFADSFSHYAKGNALKRVERPYDRTRVDQLVAHSKTLFSRQFFKERSDSGSPAVDPIFIVGMPRAGSTLVEQILATHSAVEGTMELVFIRDLARNLTRNARLERSSYPGVLATLPSSERLSLGREYLRRAQHYRRLGRPFFLDKMPNNFEHIGFIHLILPNAKIIDVRREAMSCCFAGFKQLFAHGQHFSFRLEDIGHFCGRYVELMAHYDDVLPGRIHRLKYEDLVESPEQEIRKLLDYCGLPFERECLDFHATKRPVLTPSSEQVRKPIFRDGLAHWRNFEPWLEPLKQSLREHGIEV